LPDSDVSILLKYFFVIHHGLYAEIIINYNTSAAARSTRQTDIIVRPYVFGSFRHIPFFDVVTRLHNIVILLQNYLCSRPIDAVFYVYAVAAEADVALELTTNNTHAHILLL